MAYTYTDKYGNEKTTKSESIAKQYSRDGKYSSSVTSSNNSSTPSTQSTVKTSNTQQVVKAANFSNPSSQITSIYSGVKWDPKTRTITLGDGRVLNEKDDFEINPADNKAYLKSDQFVKPGDNNYVVAGEGEVPSSPLYDPDAAYEKYQKTIDQMYDSQRKAQLAQLSASRDKAIGELSQQRSRVEPTYTNMKNQADVTNFQAARKLKEVMAAQGLGMSGNNVTGQVALDAARQQTLGNLNLQQQQELTDIDRRTADLYNPADENALVAAIEAQRSQALMNAMTRAEDVAYKQQQDAIQNAYQRAGLTGLLEDGTRTMQGLAYDRGVFESDRTYDRGVYEFDTKFAEDVKRYGVELAMERAKLASQLSRSSGGGSGGGGSSSPSYNTSVKQNTNDMISKMFVYRDRSAYQKFLNDSIAQLVQAGISPNLDINAIQSAIDKRWPKND